MYIAITSEIIKDLEYSGRKQICKKKNKGRALFTDLLLLSAHVERVSVSRMRDFFCISLSLLFLLKNMLYGYQCLAYIYNTWILVYNINVLHAI